MPKAADDVRIEVGFDGGQAMSALVSPEDADELEKRLAEGTEHTVAIDTEDGRYTLALARIVYVKRLARESRVGFAN